MNNCTLRILDESSMDAMKALATLKKALEVTEYDLTLTEEEKATIGDATERLDKAVCEVLYVSCMVLNVKHEDLEPPSPKLATIVMEVFQEGAE